jgi:Stage II sporulation protein E (SpoIIE)/GAF domain
MRPGAQTTLADRLRDIEAVTYAAPSRLGEQALLETLLDRVKKTLLADTAAVLLLDQSARQLLAVAASGMEEEVTQGVRVPLGTGFAGRIAASGEPVILADVNRSTVSNPLLDGHGPVRPVHPGSGGFPVSSAGHLPPVLAVPGDQSARLLPIQPDPPIGATEDPPRRSTPSAVPPGGLLCCYTDGLGERRDQSLDDGIGSLAATMDKQVETSGSRAGRPVSLAEDACAAVMRVLVGNQPAKDDVAALMARRHPAG